MGVFWGAFSRPAQEASEQLSQVIGDSVQASMQLVASRRQQRAIIDQISTAMRSIDRITVKILARYGSPKGRTRI